MLSDVYRSGHMRANCLGREVECRFCKKTDHHYLICTREKDKMTRTWGGESGASWRGNARRQPPEVNFEALGEAVTKKRVTPLQMVLHVLDQQGPSDQGKCDAGYGIHA